TTQTVDRSNDLAQIVEVANVFDWMRRRRVSFSILKGEDRDLVLGHVIFRQANFSAEDRDQVCILQLRRPAVRTMALDAETVAAGPQQLFVLTAMWLMASRATLLECRLMQNFLGGQHLRLIGVAPQADLYAIRLRQSRILAGMWIVAVGAISGR